MKIRAKQMPKSGLSLSAAANIIASGGYRRENIVFPGGACLDPLNKKISPLIH